MINYNKLEKIKQAKNELERLKININRSNEEIERYKELVTSGIEDKYKVQQILDSVKIILEKITFDSKARIEDFVTYGLNQIFPDRNYRFELSIKENGKRTGLDITLVENDIPQQINDSVGGGILSTIGLLLQIYYIEIYDLRRIMFLDESLKEVSKGDNSKPDVVDYLYNVISFLKYLTKERGYTFVIVTHDPAVRELADSLYFVSKGTAKLES